MLKECDYCNTVITNKNKQFCKKECMENFMKMKSCHCCGEKYDSNNDVFDGCDHFCSEECKDKSKISQKIRNIETCLGYGSYWTNFDYDLVELNYKIKNSKTGEIIEGRIGSKIEELEAYDGRRHKQNDI